MSNTGPTASPGAVTILCDTRCYWDAERRLTLTIVEFVGNRIIARFRGEDPLVSWLVSRSQMTAVDDTGRVFPRLYDVAGDRDLEDIISAVFEGTPAEPARSLSFYVEDRSEPLAVVELPSFPGPAGVGSAAGGQVPRG